MSVKDDPDVWPYLPALQDAAARARAMQAEVNRSEASRVAARRSRADGAPGAFSGYQDHWDDQDEVNVPAIRFTYNEAMRSMLEDTVRAGLTTDGAPHKQWALTQVAHILGIEISADPGIAP